MTDYTELVKFLRGLSPWVFPQASKNRMLDATAAIEALEAEVDALKHDLSISVRMNNELLNMEPKRGEMVEVVRCKECRWLFDDSNTFWKPCEVVIPDNDWFCWCGERREVQE